MEYHVENYCSSTDEEIEEVNATEENRERSNLRTLGYAHSKNMKRALIDLIPKPARRLLRSINDFAVRNLLAPPMIKLGWRPAHYTPAEAVYLGIHFGYDEEVQIKKASAVIEKHTMVSFERLATLWQQVRYLDRYSIPGALVECGVWRGGSAGMMVIAHQSCGIPRRELHLFDSFQGLPEPVSSVDGDAAIHWSGGHANGKLEPVGRCVSVRDDSERLLRDTIGYPSMLTHYHEGWFQDTLPTDVQNLPPIALLRLDGDWYESTKLCLEFLYPKVVKNGVVVIDDYGHWEGCRRAVDEFVKKLPYPVLLQHLDSAARSWVKPI